MFVFLSVFLFQITEIISISYDIIILEMDGSRKNVNAQVQPVGYRSFLLLHQVIHHKMSVLSSMHFYLSSKSTSCVICQYAAATFPFCFQLLVVLPHQIVGIRFRNTKNYTHIIHIHIHFFLHYTHNIIEKGYKKTVCPDGKYFHQNKLFFIFTLIIFSEHSYFCENLR